MIPPHLQDEYIKAHAPAPHDNGWAIAGLMWAVYSAVFLALGLLGQPVFAAVGIFAVPATIILYFAGFVGILWLAETIRTAITSWAYRPSE